MNIATIISIVLVLFLFWLAFFLGYIYGTKKEFERTIKILDDWLEELDAKKKELDAKKKELEKQWERKINANRN